MTEASYQNKLKRYFEARGWNVIKIIRASVAGYPDLQLTHPDRPTIYIEVKSNTGRLSPIQKYRHEELEAKGFKVITSRPADFDSTCTEVNAALGNPPPPLHS